MSSATKKIQIINSLKGEPEYVLLPYAVYQELPSELKLKLVAQKNQ